MLSRLVVGSCLALAAFSGCLEAGDAFKSGPQVGDKIPGPFNPLNVTGSAAGSKACQVWKNGSNPVAMVFARQISDPLTSLVKKIDAATAQHNSCKMGSFIVFCSDDESLEAKLKDLAKKEKLEHIVLTIDNPQGPPRYKLAKDADVTVVLYENREVKANHAFKKGELGESDINQIVAEVSKIIPAKEKDTK